MGKKKVEAVAGDGAYSELGHLVRTLHETLRGLGCDESLQRSVGELPDTQDRLNYIAALTEQAANRSLNAVEQATPIQAGLEADAQALAEAWRALPSRSGPEFEALEARMLAFLDEVPQRTQETAAHLNEIMMAQDFQDLTGQVIKKVTQMAQELEQQLVHILLIAQPDGAKKNEGLENGPQVKKGAADAVNSQEEVDDLLNSLGF